LLSHGTNAQIARIVTSHTDPEGSARMVRLWETSFTRQELNARVGRLEQLGGVELVDAADGPGRGVRLLQFATGGGFDFEVLVDRGFDVGRASYRGIPLAWWSPVGLIAPALTEWRGMGWFRGFAGGLVSTCGLDHTLLGGVDDTPFFNYPHSTTQEYGLHGRITGIPSRLIGYGTDWSGDEAVLWAEAEVRQVALFAEQLVLRRRIEADLGGLTLRITDTVTNIGSTRCPHMFLYHCNVGFPIVAPGAEIVYPAAEGVCVSEASSSDYRALTAPRADFVEECYEHDMVPDAGGTVSAAVLNRAIGLGVVQHYGAATLPHHITWRQLGEGAYVVAMEPSTNRDAGRFDAEERGELIMLAPGESRQYRLEVGALVGGAALDAFAADASAAASSVKTIEKERAS
jgi:hypothetical protein